MPGIFLRRMTEEDLEEIRKIIKSEHLVIGTKKVLKQLRHKKLSKIFMSANVPKEIEDDLNHFSKIANIKLVKLEMPNDELGTFCKKPFSISVIGLV
jgi:large subunit ribosomal protein L30e